MNEIMGFEVDSIIQFTGKVAPNSVGTQMGRRSSCAKSSIRRGYSFGCVPGIPSSRYHEDDVPSQVPTSAAGKDETALSTPAGTEATVLPNILNLAVAVVVVVVVVVVRYSERRSGRTLGGSQFRSIGQACDAEVRVDDMKNCGVGLIGRSAV
jgi:hypothetical protein